MCELCVDVARLNNIPYTLPRVVSLPSEIVLSARGFQSELTLVFNIQIFSIMAKTNWGITSGLIGKLGNEKRPRFLRMAFVTW